MRSTVLGVLLVGLVCSPRPARAQVIVIDDVILLSRASNNREQARTSEHLGPEAQRTELPPAPGSDEPELERPGRYGPQLGNALYRTQEPGRKPIVVARRPLSAPSRAPTGTLDLPADDHDGPPDGLLLDQAIDRLLTCNYDLRRIYEQLPKADADRLSAGLRNNPFLFLSADSIPYGSFSPQRPGATNYDITLIQPIDVSGKRRSRILVADRAKEVREAQYQNAVRREIDRLYTAFADVLEARETLLAARAGVAQDHRLAEATGALRQRGAVSQADVAETAVRRFDSEQTMHAAEHALRQARRNLATLLALPADGADQLAVRDSVHDRSPAPPSVEALVALALQVRPDLAAHRLGVTRARAEFQMQRSEGLEDVYLFYSPYHSTNFAPQDKQVATGWALGVLVPIPVLNRNQGNIARARSNITQTQLALEGLERTVANEVQNAAADYRATGEAVRGYEQEGLPAINRLRQETFREYADGKQTLGAYLSIQGKYNDMVRRYLAALVRHRRAMLALNTAVAQRLLP
jgi:cobalt-zinc-cadmium efflux system outer membrane protein